MNNANQNQQQQQPGGIRAPPMAAAWNNATARYTDMLVNRNESLLFENQEFRNRSRVLLVEFERAITEIERVIASNKGKDKRICEENKAKDKRIEQLCEENKAKDKRIEQLCEENKAKDKRIAQLCEENKAKDKRFIIDC